MNKVREYFMNKKYRKIAIVFLCLAIFFSVFSYTSRATNNFNLEPLNFIRVGLTELYAKKSQIKITNKNITLGYDEEDFLEVEDYECKSGFYFVFNDSNRYVSSTTYENVEELKETLNEINDDNDYMILYLDKNQYKIITKPNREATDICDKLYDNMKSIVMINGDNKEQAIFENINNPLIYSNDNDDFPMIKIYKTTDKNGVSYTSDYRGYIKLIKDGDGITAINILDFEEYLYGVVTCEMPKSWEPEALKAQAVTARSYAYKKAKANLSSNYDVTNTTASQVYKGVDGESKESIKAVDSTAHEVIVYTGSNKTYYGKVCEAYFSSCNGGVTERSDNVWSANLPYFVSKEDPYEKPNSYTDWILKFDLDDLQRVMDNRHANIGTVTGVTVSTSSDSNRVISFNVKGSKGTYSETKDKIRSFLTDVCGKTCYSTNFELYSEKNPKVEVKKTDKEIFVFNKGIQKNESKFLKNLYIYDNNEDEEIKINDNVNVIDKDGVITELKIVNEEAKEIEGYKLKKGEYMIIGSGFGHGVGLSQYGANDMAKEGFNYDKIIKFYFEDVDIIAID